MELFSFVRFRASAGNERAVAEALGTVLEHTRGEAGCLSIHAFRGIRDPRIFYIHFRWKSEEAFEAHARLPHTVQFLQRIEGLIEGSPEFTRTELLG